WPQVRRAIHPVRGMLLAILALGPTVLGYTQEYTFTTLAGPGGGPGAVDSTGKAARFNAPNGVAVDSAGNIYVADMLNHTIRKVTQGGEASTLAGLAGSPGSANGGQRGPVQPATRHGGGQ